MGGWNGVKWRLKIKREICTGESIRKREKDNRKENLELTIE